MTKFSPEAVERIIGSMRAGVGLGRAAALEGISAQTLLNWRKKGESDPDGPYGRLFVEALKCEASVDAEAEKTVHAAILDGDVKTAQWRLERRHPDEYGPKQEVRMDAAVVTGDVDMDAVTEALREMRARRKSDGQDEA